MKTKLDSILLNAKTKSTSNFENMVTVHQSVMKTIQPKFTRVFAEQEKLISETTKKVDKEVSDVKGLFEKVDTFLKDVQEKVDTKLSAVDSTIKSLQTHFIVEKEAFSTILFRLQNDNADHHSSVSNSILDLQWNYEGESKLMDIIDAKTRNIHKMKQELKNIHSNIMRMDDDISLVKGRKFWNYSTLSLHSWTKRWSFCWLFIICCNYLMPSCSVLYPRL